eukprot:1324978-Amorphochlora_amoeboformis.AAC.1
MERKRERERQLEGERKRERERERERRKKERERAVAWCPSNDRNSGTCSMLGGTCQERRERWSGPTRL